MHIICIFFLLSYLTCSQIWLNYFLDDRHFDYMTKSLKKPCFMLSEAANTWGIFPRCAELGRAVGYFEIAPTLGLNPLQICITYIKGCREAFHPSMEGITAAHVVKILLYV